MFQRFSTPSITYSSQPGREVSGRVEDNQKKSRVGIMAATESTLSPSDSAPGLSTHSTEKPKRPGKQVVRVMIALLVVGLAAGGARVWLWPYFRHQEPTNELVLYGNVDIRQVQLAFNGNDRIATMYVKEGDRVCRGQLLAMLDTRRLKAAVARAQAQVEVQRQIVARLEAGTRIEDIRKARADLELVEAELSPWRRTWNCMRTCKGFPMKSGQSATGN